MDRGVPEDGSFGVLVGWSHQNLGERLDLHLQCMRAADPGHRPQVGSHHLFLTRQQAAILANYLFEVSGQSPPRKRPGPLARLLGS